MMKTETEKASENIFSFQGRRQRIVERRQMGCGSSPDVKPLPSLLRLVVMLQNTGAGFLLQHSWFRRPLPSTSSKLRNQRLVQG